MENQDTNHVIMKTYFFQSIRNLTFATSLILMLFTTSSIAQEQSVPDDLFFEIACFKAKGPDAEAFFKNYGKPIHEEMIRQGILVNWEFFTVDYPTGSDCDCRYRAVRVFRGIGSLDKIKSDEIREKIIKKIWPNKSRKDIQAEFSKNVEFKSAEVYRLIDALIPDKTISNLLFVNFMDVKPVDRGDYLKMEDEYFKPLHAAANKSGKLVDWFVAQRVLPYGTNTIETDYITVDKFNNYEDFYALDFDELFKSVHPKVDADTIWKKIAEKRKLAKMEIWRRAHDICAENQVKPTKQ